MKACHYASRFLLVLLSLYVVTGTSHGQVLTWAYPGGNNGAGLFQTATNWIPSGVPGVSNLVLFPGTAANTQVNFNASATTAAFVQQQGNVTLNLSPSQTYTVTGNNGFLVGTAPNATAGLTISGGGLLHLTNFNSGLATSAGTLVSLDVNGSGTRVVTDFWNDVGVQGTAQLTVHAGASYQTGGFSSVGLTTNSKGFVNVIDPGSQFSSGPGMAFGNSGEGYLQVSSGGLATLGANAVFGVTATGRGFLTIGGTGTAQVNSNGMTIGSSGLAIATVSNGSTLNNVGAISIAALAGSGASLNLMDAASIMNQSGGSIYVGGTSSAAGGTGIVQVGAGTTLNVTGAGNGIVVRGGHGSIILDGGTISTPSLSRRHRIAIEHQCR